MSNLRILVTGGLGAVGSKLVAELRGRGHDVWILDLPHHHDRQYLRADIGEHRQLASVFEDASFDFVYHLAAEFGRWNGEDFYETMWRTNAVGTKNLIRQQEKYGFKMVFTSSSEVYGDFDGVMAEDVLERNSIHQLNDYAISKWVNEMQIMNSASMHGTETVRVRLFNTYGPGEPYSSYRSANCMFVYHALHDLPFRVFTRHRRTSTYIDDCVRSLANTTECFRPGEVYNIAGTELHDMKMVSDFILGYLGKDDALVTYSDVEPSTTLVKRADTRKARRDLGHQSTVDLEVGLQRTIEWQREFYGIG